jgi:hypothetical protein
MGGKEVGGDATEGGDGEAHAMEEEGDGARGGGGVPEEFEEEGMGIEVESVDDVRVVGEREGRGDGGAAELEPAPGERLGNGERGRSC